VGSAEAIEGRERPWIVESSGIRSRLTRVDRDPVYEGTQRLYSVLPGGDYPPDGGFKEMKGYGTRLLRSLKFAD
jgi:hypothetical protein